MAVKGIVELRGKHDDSKPKDILVRKAPGILHKKIKRYMNMVGIGGRDLTKDEAVVELLETATKDIDV